jgi:REP element-mobilizing transposase RayT
MPDLPERTRLHHQPPAWVEDDALFFITICCAVRGSSQLDNAVVFTLISSAVERYVETGKWWVDSFLIMPDHLHALISFPELSKMEKTIRDWKRYVAKQTKIVWQNGFFDHRVRSKKSAREKWHYILNNPVRKGLVSDPLHWPYVLFPTSADYL